MRKFSASTTLCSPVILIWCNISPFSSYTITYPDGSPISSSFELGAQQIIDILCSYSFPHRRFPYTPPTITCPSSYAMHIFVPSGLHFISLTVDDFLLFTISYIQFPLCFMNTMIIPVLSQDVNFRYL